MQGAGESQHFNGCPPGTVLHPTLPMLPQYDMVPAEALKLEAPWDHSRLPMPDLQDKQHVSTIIKVAKKKNWKIMNSKDCSFSLAKPRCHSEISVYAKI